VEHRVQHRVRMTIYSPRQVAQVISPHDTRWVDEEQQRTLVSLECPHQENKWPNTLTPATLEPLECWDNPILFGY
jgi:hypothetical protein